MRKLFIFIIVSFVVGFISDIALNDLSRTTKAFSTLQPYFKQQLITASGAFAGTTVAIATSILLVIFNLIYKTHLPLWTLKSVGMFLCTGYVVGYLLDVFIEKMNIFGDKLKPFYAEFGSGNSGAIAFVFALLISLFTCNYVLEI